MVQDTDVREVQRSNGLTPAGWIRSGGPCPKGAGCPYADERGHVHAYLDFEIADYAVYSFLVHDEVVKNGKAGSKRDTLRGRVQSEANQINSAWLFLEGRGRGNPGWHRRPLDVYKRLSPDIIRNNFPVEVWAGQFEAETFEPKERELNRLFRSLQGRLLWVDRDG